MEPASLTGCADPRVLVIGYGNAGRRDDGLGPAIAETLGGLALPGVQVRVAVQLAPEDAVDAARAERVIFVDAARSGREPFAWHDVAPHLDAGDAAAHGIAPETLLGLCAGVYGRAPQGRLLAVRGYAFGVSEGMSRGARANLAAAVNALVDAVRPV